MQAEEIDNEEENAGNVIQPEQSQVLHQEDNKYLIQKNTTASNLDHSDELWKTRAQKNADDFDDYSNFMNSKFGSAPAAEKAKVIEVKKDNVTQNSTV